MVTTAPRPTANLERVALVMVVVMEERATEQQIEQVVARLVEMGMDVHRSTGATRTVLGAVGQRRPDPGLIAMLDGVLDVLFRHVHREADAVVRELFDLRLHRVH